MPSVTEYLLTPESSPNGTDDREARSKFWVAAYTKSKSERKAASELTKQGIKTFVPVQSVIRQWSDRKKKVDIVVIPNILFAEISENEVPLVKRQSQVVKILSLPGQNKPAKIPSAQIERLEFMVTGAKTPVVFTPLDFKLKQKVRVVRGDLSGLVGSVEKISDVKTKLYIAIDMLGGAMVEIKTSDLQLVTE